MQASIQEIVFRNAEVNSDIILDTVMFRAWTWMTAKVKGFKYYFIQWIQGIGACIQALIY